MEHIVRLQKNENVSFDIDGTSINRTVPDLKMRKLRQLTGRLCDLPEVTQRISGNGKLRV